VCVGTSVNEKSTEREREREKNEEEKRGAPTYIQG
jgi:hypothetical protein